jgi:hypothetical protein
LPILKWKQGERIALRHITSAQWGNVVPLIELLPIKAAPDGAALRSALPAYVDKLARELAVAIPADKPVAIDVRYVSPGYARQVRLAGVVCQALQKRSGLRVIPVLQEGAAIEDAGEFATLKDFDEYVFRLNTPSLDASQVGPLTALLRPLARKSQLHLLIDQYALVDQQPASALASVQPFVDQALAAACASVTVAGGSFPVNLIGIKQGTMDIPRVEWKVWKALLASDPRFAVLRYADYTVSNPAPVPDMDPT